jgi:hypothetical protein
MQNIERFRELDLGAANLRLANVQYSRLLWSFVEGALPRERRKDVRAVTPCFNGTGRSPAENLRLIAILIHALSHSRLWGSGHD